MAEPETQHDPDPEILEVIHRRYAEAAAAGLSELEARLVAESNTDIGLLRKLVAGGCPPATIARILI